MSKFTGELMKFQEECFDFALSHPYHICNMEAGLGKTITSLAVACHSGLKTLIIVPAFLKSNWVVEIEKFTSDLDYTLTSYAGLSKIDISNYGVVICDECHYLKNHKAKRTQVVHKLLKENNTQYFIGLSGTPISNRVSEAWSLLQLCYYGRSYELFKPFNKLFYKFCNTFSYERTFDLGHVTVVRFDGIKNVEALKQLIAPVWIRKRAKDVLDLPDEIETNMVGNSKKYDKQLEEALTLFNADPNDPAYMSIKSANAMAKTDTTIKLANDLIEQGYRPVIFTCHVASAIEIASKLKALLITGSVSVDKRQEIVDNFNNNKSKCLVATIGSASTGFNITSTNYMIFNDIDFVPANIEQAKKRILRIGQKKTCFYYYIFTSKFDEKLNSMVKRKSLDIGRVYE